MRLVFTLLIWVVSAAGQCTFMLNPASRSVPATPDTVGSIVITASAGNCARTPVSDSADWLTVSFGTPGTGNGSVGYRAETNQTAFARTGRITIGNATFTLTQAAADCAITLSRQTLQVASAAGSGTLQVNTPCAWSATGTDSWLTVTSTPSGVGTGTIQYAYTANPSTAARTASIKVGTATFQLTQDGGPCSSALNPTDSASFPVGGGSGQIALIVTGTNCVWTASSPLGWVTLNSPGSGTGNGTIAYTVAPNGGTAARSLTLTISGRPFLVIQAGTVTPPASPALKFVPLDPCRVMETRAEYNFQGRTGAFGPPFLAAGETRTLNLPQSTVCQIPATAKAFVMNVTLIPRGAVDFVTVWPAGDIRPTFWTLRSPDAQIVANAAIVKAGTGGGVSVFASDAADILIDISGYFTDDANTPGYTYYPLSPCRVIDTRSAYRSPPGPFGPPAMVASERRSFVFPNATQYCQIPQGAKAYSVTITVAPPGPLQFLTAWPTGGAQPNVSSINSPAGRTLANSVILPASATGSIDAFVFDRTDVLMDITGYFAADDGQTGLFYFPVTQCRVHDALYQDDQSRAISIATASGCVGIPISAKGYAANVTVVPGGSPMPFLTLYPANQSRPNASTLNAFEGQTVTNSAIVPGGPGGALDIYAYRRTQVVLEISGFFNR